MSRSGCLWSKLADKCWFKLSFCWIVLLPCTCWYFFWPCFPKTMTRLDLNWYKTRFHVSSLFPIISPIFIFTEMVLIGWHLKTCRSSIVTIKKNAFGFLCLQNALKRHKVYSSNSVLNCCNMETHIQGLIRNSINWPELYWLLLLAVYFSTFLIPYNFTHTLDEHL